jgi:hypothetical protein
MSNSDILSKADRVLRPVLKELGQFSWMRIEGCCAGHKPEDNLWIEVNVLGLSGLERLMELMRILDAKLTGSETRVDCLLSYAAGEEGPVPHGWIPVALEVFWPAVPEWRRNQSLIVEAWLSSIEEIGSRGPEPAEPRGAINYCPFCSSSFIRIDNFPKPGESRYRCGDCEMTWSMTDPVV